MLPGRALHALGPRAHLLVICGVVLVLIATRRAGHDWGDDFSMYIAHARNIADWRPYADTGYVYNPAYASLGPRAYPPVLPLLLAPVVKLFGIDLEAMKLELILVLGIALVLLFRIFRRTLSAQQATVAIAAIGFSPLIWQAKDNVLSEFPFLLFASAALLLADDEQTDPEGPGRWVGRGVLLGTVLACATGARLIGLVLLPAILGSELVRHRRLRAHTVLAVVVFALLAAAQQALLRAQDLSYLDQFDPDPARWLADVTTNANGYLHLYAGLWSLPWLSSLGPPLLAFVTALALIGYVAELRRGLRAWIAFVPLYLLGVGLFPGYLDVRYLIPLWPFFVLCVFAAIRPVGDRLGSVGRPALGSSVLAAFMLGYASWYTRADLAPLSNGVAGTSANGLFAYVRTATDPRAIFVFRKPRAFALFTGRRAAVYPRNADASGAWQYAQAVQASYIVLGLDDGPLPDVVKAHPDRLQLDYANEQFAVYQLRDSRDFAVEMEGVRAP